MSTINFSVPEEIKQIFNQTFEGCNKSAVIAGLMLEAVEREARRRKAQAAYSRIVRRRKRAPTIDEAEVRAAREAGRP